MGHQPAERGIDLGAEPVVAVGEQAASVGTEPAPHIDYAPRRRAGTMLPIQARQWGWIRFSAAL